MKTQIIHNVHHYAITADHLKIVFNEHQDDEFVVLEDFTHKFEKNRIYFIVGNSGTGKTSLVTHFNGLLKSKYGNLTVGNMEIRADQRKIRHFKQLRRNVGMVFQFPEYQLFKDTVEKDIIFGPVNLGDKKDRAKVLAKKYLNMMGLEDEYLQRSPFGLSGGQKRRVAIAGVLAIEPAILVFDEPTAGLDPAGEKEMMNIILDLKKQGKTIIVITHVMDQVLALGDEVIVLDQKKVAAIGSPYEIFTNKGLLQTTTMELPRVIRTIDLLVNKDKRFQKLYDLKPRNVAELAQAIHEIIRGGV